MKKLIITSLILLSSMFCFSQNIYQVKVNYLEIGVYNIDTTSTWRDSVLVNQPTIVIYQDSLVMNGVTSYKFLSLRETNPGVHSFVSVEGKTNKSYIVTYFTSPCLDNTSITVIVEDDKTSYNYYGKIE